VIATDIWRHTGQKSTCISCKSNYRPTWTRDQQTHIRVVIAKELEIFDNPSVGHLLEILRETKDKLRDLTEEVKFQKFINENLKLKLTFK